MAEIKFDYSALKKSDQDLYDKLSATDRKSFETAWIEIEKEKVKLQQKKNRLTKVKNNQKEKERKERTRYLIQLGAILDKALGEKFDTPTKNAVAQGSSFPRS